MHGGREAQLIFFILARSSFPVPPHMRIEALYLVLMILDIWHPYSRQTKEVTPGMYTSSIVRDFSVVISFSIHWKGLTFPLLKKHDVKSQPVRA